MFILKLCCLRFRQTRYGVISRLPAGAVPARRGRADICCGLYTATHLPHYLYQRRRKAGGRACRHYRLWQQCDVDAWALPGGRDLVPALRLRGFSPAPSASGWRGESAGRIGFPRCCYSSKRWRGTVPHLCRCAHTPILARAMVAGRYLLQPLDLAMALLPSTCAFVPFISACLVRFPSSAAQRRCYVAVYTHGGR